MRRRRFWLNFDSFLSGTLSIWNEKPMFLKRYQYYSNGTYLGPNFGMVLDQNTVNSQNLSPHPNSFLVLILKHHPDPPQPCSWICFYCGMKGKLPPYSLIFAVKVCPTRKEWRQRAPTLQGQHYKKYFTFFIYFSISLQILFSTLAILG
jgi:hypothetical protein